MIMDGGPQLDYCEGSCGTGKLLHHACNVQWLEKKGVDAELGNLYIDCVVQSTLVIFYQSVDAAIMISLILQRIICFESK